MTSPSDGSEKTALLSSSSSEFLTNGKPTINGSTEEINTTKLPPKYERRIGPGKSSFFGAVFVVTNAAMGAGMLTFPYSFYLAGGWYWGLMIEAIIIPFIIGSLIMLAYCAELKQTVTCEETMGEMLGPAARLITEILVCLYCFGCCVTLLVVMGDQIEDVTSAFSYHGQSLSEQWWASRQFLVFLAAVVLIYPWLYLKKIGILSYTSFLGIISCVYICIIIIVKYFLLTPSFTCNAPKFYHSTDCSHSWMTAFNSIPFVCFAFQCHVSSIPVYSGLKRRTVSYFTLVILVAVFICTLLYSLTGVFALLTFSGHSCLNSDILRNYCPTDVSVSVARGMLFLCLMTSYPILAFCGRVSLEGLVSRFESVLPMNKKLSIYCSSQCPSWCNLNTMRILLLVHIWLIGSLVLALFVPEIKDVISPLGSLAAVFIFVLPGLCLLSLSLKFHFDSVWKNVTGMIVSCFVVSIGSFVLIDALVYNVMDDFHLL